MHPFDQSLTTVTWTIPSSPIVGSYVAGYSLVYLEVYFIGFFFVMKRLKIFLIMISCDNFTENFRVDSVVNVNVMPQPIPNRMYYS